MDPEPPPDGSTGELAEEAAAIRRMVEQGAGSPEEIRDLAARLREHREREEMRWRADVRPVLKKQGKGRFRGHGGPGSAPGPEAVRSPASQSAWVGLGLLALVLIVVIAANTSVWVLLLPVLVLLGWAWHQGRADRPG